MNLFASDLDGKTWKVISLNSAPSNEIDVLLEDVEGNLLRDWAKNLTIWDMDNLDNE